MAKKAAKAEESPVATRDRGPSLVIWMTAGEKAVIKAATTKSKQRFPASWARTLLLTEAEKVLGKVEYDRLVNALQSDDDQE